MQREGKYGAAGHTAQRRMIMSFEGFLKLVEIRTKVASVVPFLIGTLYATYRFDRFDPKNFILMLISLIAFDMVTTAINNYYDWKKARKTHGYNYESHNAIVSCGLKETTVVLVITVLLATAVIFGFLLFLNTTPAVLLLGAASFSVGVLYSFGPVPISRTPLGELFSGLFMGFVVVLIAVYVHAFDAGIIELTWSEGILGISVNLAELAYIFLLSVPTVNGIANIMLANNLCDMDDDVENGRYTLPVYIGRDTALWIFGALYYICYADIMLLLLLGIIPMTAAATFLTFIPVIRNIRSFYAKQSKKDTFALSVKNFLMINGVQLLAFSVALIARAVV